MRRPVVLVPQFFGSLVFERQTSRYLPFDAEATATLRALASRGIAAVDAETPPEHRAALRSFFGHFERRGFFTLDGFLAAEILEAAPPADHLLGPLATHVEVIGACNLACAHCFAAPLPRNHDALTLAELDRLFRELAAIGSFRLGLTGGEPLMRPDFFEVVDSAVAAGLHPCLTTNALFVTDEIAVELGKRPLVWLNVSLDGATAETNDAVRGAGTFERVREKLSILRRHARFTLAFTITSANAAEVESCAAFAREAGAHTAVFRPIYPTGAARAKPGLMPSFAQYSEALVTLGSKQVRGLDPFSPQARVATQAKVFSNHGCGAGNTVASVNVRGEVNPCSFLGSLFDAGNIRTRPFREIWDASAGFVRMRSLSTKSVEGKFQGGCRARSLASHGDVDAPDPWYREWRERLDAAPPGFNLELSLD